MLPSAPRPRPCPTTCLLPTFSRIRRATDVAARGQGGLWRTAAADPSPRRCSRVRETPSHSDILESEPTKELRGAPENSAMSNCLFTCVLSSDEVGTSPFFSEWTRGPCLYCYVLSYARADSCRLPLHTTGCELHPKSLQDDCPGHDRRVDSRGVGGARKRNVGDKLDCQPAPRPPWPTGGVRRQQSEGRQGGGRGPPSQPAERVPEPGPFSRRTEHGHARSWSYAPLPCLATKGG